MKIAIGLFVAFNLIWSVYSSPAGLFCNSSSEGRIIGSMFSKLYRDRDASNCPSEKWLELFKDSDVKAGNKQSYKIINIGFNKGYNFASWLNVFAPNMNVDIPQWYEVMLAQANVAGSCGACQDCKTPPIKSPHIGTTDPLIHFVGVDLNMANLDMVNKIVTNLNKTRDLSKMKLDLIHGAGGSLSSATVKIPRCAMGNEVCKIPDSPGTLDPNMQFDEVKVIGVDKLVHDMHLLRPPHGANSSTISTTITASTTSTNAASTITPKRRSLERIDILHIDTEGNDAEVLKTATMLLKHHKVRALVFEYHHFLPWGHTKLSEVAARVSSNNMECFFEGQDRLWPITGLCWNEQYEFHQWSNVLCVLRTDPWLQAILPLVQTLPTLRSPYPDNTLLQFVEYGKRDQPSTNTVYLIQDNKRHAFRDGSVFRKRGYKRESIVQVYKKMIIEQLFAEGEMLV